MRLVYLKQTKNGVTISVVVSANAKADAIKGEYGSDLKISIAAPPVDDKANLRIIKFFSDLLGCSRANIQIIAGAHSAKKTILVLNSSLEIVAGALSCHLSANA